MSKLHEMLLANDKKKIFNFGGTPSIGYPSGLLPLDYSNGYWVHVNNKGNTDVPKQWLNIGTQGGSFYTIIGNSGVAKTTLAVQIGSAEIYDFTFGDFYHIDAEGTSNPTRVQMLNRFSDDLMLDKYHFPDLIYVEDTFKMIYELAQMKISNKDFAYYTGCYDQMGNEIIIPQPTVVLIDSLPSLQTKDVEDSNELGSQTYNMRLAIAYNTFYKRLRPIIRDANITTMAINHIKEKPEMGFVKTQAKIQYLKPSESIPGGSGPIYYSQNLLRMIYRGKFTEEKHGFGGFMVEAMNLKSKTNKSGTSVHLVFHEKYGFEPIITLMNYADELGLVHGRNPYCFFESAPDIKFNTKDISYIHDERIHKILMDECKPYLMNMVGESVLSDRDISPTELMRRLEESYRTTDAKKDELVDTNKITGEAQAAALRTMIRNANEEHFKEMKSHKRFKGIHRYGVSLKNQPPIEQYLTTIKGTQMYMNATMHEMHSVPYIDGTREVGFYVAG